MLISNWETYTNETYLPQVEQMENEGIDFLIKKSTPRGRGISWKDNIHPLIKKLYTRAHSLKPKSIYEIGCAGGHNLYNLKKLIKGVKVAGCELLESQIKIMGEKFKIPKTIMKNIELLDFAGPISIKESSYDFVFTNAVIMHLDMERAEIFLGNTNRIAKKYIYLSENQGQHDYKTLFAKTGLDQFKIEALEIGFFISKA